MILPSNPALDNLPNSWKKAAPGSTGLAPVHNPLQTVPLLPKSSGGRPQTGAMGNRLMAGGTSIGGRGGTPLLAPAARTMKGMSRPGTTQNLDLTPRAPRTPFNKRQAGGLDTVAVGRIKSPKTPPKPDWGAGPGPQKLPPMQQKDGRDRYPPNTARGSTRGSHRTHHSRGSRGAMTERMQREPTPATPARTKLGKMVQESEEVQRFKSMKTSERHAQYPTLIPNPIPEP